MNDYQKTLLEETGIFDSRDWLSKVKMRAEGSKNITGEEAEKMYKELCKALVKSKEGIILSFNEQPDEVQEKVWEMSNFLFN